MPKLIAEAGGEALEQQLVKARELYKQEKYQAALFTYNKAIQIRAAILPSKAFDGRAAVHIKLRDYPAALKDAKQTIHSAKNEAKGYLRTVQVLRLMEKAEAATKICQYGLERVPPGDSGYSLLEMLRDQLAKDRAPKTYIDLMTFLPTEIIEMVLEFLSFRDIARIRRVSKGWRHLIETLPRVWRHLDLSSANKPVSKKFISTCLRCSQGTTIAATLKYFPKFPSLDDIYILADRCRRLQYLRCMDKSFDYGPKKPFTPGMTSHLTTIIVDDKIETRQVTQVLNSHKSLVTAIFHNISIERDQEWHGDFTELYPQLTTLVLKKSTADIGGLLLHVEDLIIQAPNLRKLHLHRIGCLGKVCLPFKLLEQLEDLSLRDSSYCALPLLPDTLRSLSLGRGGVGPFHDDQEDGLGQANLNRLEILEIQGWRFPNNWFDELLANCKGNLRRLEFTNCGEFMPSLAPIFDTGFLRQLEVLLLPVVWGGPKGRDLGCSGVVTDCDAQYLAQHAPNLQELDLSQSLATGVGIKALVHKVGKPLKKLAFDDRGLISFDGIAYARKSGIEVTVRGESKVGKGRKVRGL